MGCVGCLRDSQCSKNTLFDVHISFRPIQSARRKRLILEISHSFFLLSDLYHKPLNLSLTTRHLSSPHVTGLSLDTQAPRALSELEYVTVLPPHARKEVVGCVAGPRGAVSALDSRVPACWRVCGEATLGCLSLVTTYTGLVVRDVPYPTAGLFLIHA